MSTRERAGSSEYPRRNKYGRSSPSGLVLPTRYICLLVSCQLASSSHLTPLELPSSKTSPGKLVVHLRPSPSGIINPCVLCHTRLKGATRFLLELASTSRQRVGLQNLFQIPRSPLQIHNPNGRDTNHPRG